VADFAACAGDEGDGFAHRLALLGAMTARSPAIAAAVHKKVVWRERRVFPPLCRNVAGVPRVPTGFAAEIWREGG
jgi:hypothetical protein